MPKIAVASKNQVKLEAVKLGFEQMFSDQVFEVVGESVPSGVTDQPMSNAETLLGAENRVNALTTLLEADYYVGVEGGVEPSPQGMQSFAWIIVRTRDGKIGRAKTGHFILPNKIAELVLSGIELGKADDVVFGTANSKQANGSVGLLTGDVITRTTLYEHAVVLALIPFKQPTLY